jgi:hypothetical protein
VVEEPITLSIRGTCQNPASRRCYGKVAYPDLRTGEARARKASEKNGDLIIAYQYFDSRLHLIGHTDKYQRSLRHEVLQAINTIAPVAAN